MPSTEPAIADAEAIARDLPPSASYVYWTLEREEEVTGEQLRTEVYLGKSTTRYAIRRLQEVGLVKVRPNPADPRMRIYERADVGRTDSGPD